jgi:predicted dithiol-disulfide oxidoreductase (DUF899 family)
MATAQVGTREGFTAARRELLEREAEMRAARHDENEDE